MTRPGTTRVRRCVLCLSSLLVLPLVASCSFPAERFDTVAESLGLERSTVFGTTFTHAVFVKPGLARAASPGQVLHVYLEGDGSPMLGDFPNPDPTPRRPLALRLMALDPQAAVYLGRPCYHGEMAPPGCTPALWTTGRYGEAVVASLVAAARRIARGYRFHRLALFGYSGGGTLALLMAGRMAETRSVVTLAAVLDTEAWAKDQRLPLDGSLNPVPERGLVRKTIVQRHYAGGRDVVVPRSLAARAAQLLEVPLILVDRFDHVCCWEASWPDILASLEDAAPNTAQNE